MKIAMFTDTYVPQVNGVTYVVQEFSQILARQHEVRIYAPAYGLRRRTEWEGRVLIERYPSIPVLTYREVNIPIFWWPGLVKCIREFGPDIIHFHSPATLGLAAIRIAKQEHIPLVGTYHTLFSEVLPALWPFKLIHGNKLRNFIWRLSAKIFNRCDLIVSTTPVIAQELRAHNHTARIEVVSNGIDLTLFTPKQTYGGQKLIYVGRVSAEKNIEMVTRAFAVVAQKLPQAKLEIIGGGPDLGQLQNLVGQLNLTNKVSFLGYIERRQLGEYYRAASVFVSGSAMETQGLTFLEAMACGLPVVGVNFAGAKSVIEPEINGFMVERGDVVAMAKKIELLLTDKNLNLRMGKAGLNTAQKNDQEASVVRMEELYQSLLV